MKNHDRPLDSIARSAYRRNHRTHSCREANGHPVFYERILLVASDDFGIPRQPLQVESGGKGDTRREHGHDSCGSETDRLPESSTVSSELKQSTRQYDVFHRRIPKGRRRSDHEPTHTVANERERQAGMVEPNELDELREFVDQAIETIYMTSGPRRPPVSRLIIGMHCESTFSEMHRHLVVSTRVFCIAVNDHHRSARLI
jgi:hypothetical protein